MAKTKRPVGQPLRILAVHRYYWPDTAPYGMILRSIATRWAQDGHQVEVLSTQPSYATGAKIASRDPVEIADGVRVRRVRLLREAGRGTIVRLLNMFMWINVVFFYTITRGRFDIVMVGTTPPVIAAAAMRLAAKFVRARVIYHCMDIHPEIGKISGEFKNPILYGLLRRIDATNSRKAHRVVVLSTDMRGAIHARPGGKNASVAVINNFETSDDDIDTNHPTPVIAGDVDRFRIIFTGNIGRFQGLETVVDALATLDSRNDWEMVFVGDGKARDDLYRRAGKLVGNKIHFVPYQPIGVVRTMIRDSDFCLVSLAPQISRYAYPCKTMTYLREGRPILVCAELDSDLARLVRREQIGVTVPPADPHAFADEVARLAADPDLRSGFHRRAVEIGPRLFDKSNTLDQWSELITKN